MTNASLVLADLLVCNHLNNIYNGTYKVTHCGDGTERAGRALCGHMGNERGHFVSNPRFFVACTMHAYRDELKLCPDCVADPDLGLLLLKEGTV